MGLFSNDKFKCARCGRANEPLGYAPIPTELGQKIGAEMCQDCWKEWQEKQKQLINHFGLDVSNPDTHEMLFDNMRIFFYNEGVDITQIDTSQEGKVNW
jgi:Fe-S cluster biosynthesis and repair protein YggX